MVRSSRRRAREFALQGLYQWQLAGTDAATIAGELAQAKGFDKIDADYFRQLLHGTIADAPDLQARLAPCLDREFSRLSPVERAILLMSAYELTRQIDVPYRVVINEAVDLAKAYGGTDGYKFVNGVLDKVAPRLRPGERRSGNSEK
jgi:N utilization substance protein B